MIKSKTMYQMFYKYVDTRIAELEKDIQEREKDLESITTILCKHIELISRTVHPISLFNGKIKELGKDEETLEYKYVNVQVKIYYSQYTVLSSLKAELEHLQAQKVKYVVYYQIIALYNERVLEFALKTGKNVFFKGIGNFYVEYATTNRKRINWHESKKQKQKLIEQGYTPFNKKDYIKATKEGKEYDGKEWFVYHPKSDIWFKMEFWRIFKKKIPALKDYIFKPTRGRGSAMLLLNNYKKTLTEEDFLKYRTNA